jgi:hypothetical protein
LELGRAVKEARRRGYVVAHAVFKRRHTSADKLADQVEQLRSDFSKLKVGRWRSLVKRFGIDGPGRGGVLESRLYSVSSFEATWGYNGWHPHLHVLFFLAPGSDASEFGDEVRDLWYRLLGGGFDFMGVPMDAHLWDNCLSVTCNDGDVAEYIQKFGRDPRWDVADEVAKSVRKSGRSGRSPHYTPSDLLASYMDTGSRLHGQLWVEFGLVMRGRNQLVWSPYLREFFGLGAEQSDSEIVDDDSDYQVQLVVLDDLTWRIVRRTGKRAALLSVADGGDRVALSEWLYKLRGGFCPPGPPGGSECVEDDYG